MGGRDRVLLCRRDQKESRNDAVRYQMQNASLLTQRGPQCARDHRPSPSRLCFGWTMNSIFILKGSSSVLLSYAAETTLHMRLPAYSACGQLQPCMGGRDRVLLCRRERKLKQDSRELYTKSVSSYAAWATVYSKPPA
jgi:hypothetical protein